MRTSCKNRLNWPEFAWVIKSPDNRRWLELLLYSCHTFLSTVWLDQFIAFIAHFAFFFFSFLLVVTQKWHILNTMLVIFFIADNDCVKKLYSSVCRNALILSLIRKFCSSSIYSIILCIVRNCQWRITHNFSATGLYKKHLSLFTASLLHYLRI